MFVCLFIGFVQAIHSRLYGILRLDRWVDLTGTMCQVDLTETMCQVDLTETMCQVDLTETMSGASY